MSEETFRLVGSLKSGYDPEQVDSFLSRAKVAYAEAKDTDVDEETVRSVAFDWVRNGYDPDLVDSALDRLEAAFIQRRRARVMAADGETAWLDETYKQATSLYPRLLRPAGERFADAADAGYDKDDVDFLLDRIAEYFDGHTGLTSSEVRSATFRKARGESAYSEAVVDVYLDRAVTVLLAVE